jgi:hypothetical protein
MRPFRNYRVFSVGLAIAWAIAFALVFAIKGSQSAQTLFLVFLVFCIGWVSMTIARYVYPPPQRKL